MKKIALLFSVLSLAACNNGGGGNNNSNPAPTNNVTLSEQNVTDTSGCNSGQAPSSLVGSWNLSFVYSNPSSPITVSSKMTLTLNSDGTGAFSNQCTFNDGEVVNANVSVTYKTSGSSLTLQNGSSDTEKNSDGNLSCTVSATTLGSVTYSFQGACLVLDTPNSNPQTITLVPAQ